MKHTPGDLLPCPFCGSTKLSLLRGVADWVECRLCRAQGPQVRGFGEAERHWNGPSRWRTTVTDFKPCSHGAKMTEPCIECDIVWYREMLDDAARRVLSLNNKLRELEASRATQPPQPGEGNEGDDWDFDAAYEAAAKIVDQCNREGPYNAIGAASRIRALKRGKPQPGEGEDKG